ncbi:CPCC family cysteine-rich protein [Hymenobacter swuensis]|uniref:CPCC family cysteine-rich protein n=1 Tax=Hymenobacter swuensis TaxID=1446467 RepID=UPI0009DF6BE7|nr:CPCC family cysteine-rich protein [Hymenobacter swuensis]
MEINAAQLHELQQRRQFFAAYFPKIDCCLNQLKHEAAKLNTCPACGYPTLGERAGYEICSICEWEDDGQDDEAADEIWGGPNGNYSLTQWRRTTAEMLAILTTSSAAHRPEKKLIGLLLNSIQASVRSGHANESNKMIEQIETITLLFEKLRNDQCSGLIKSSPG